MAVPSIHLIERDLHVLSVDPNEEQRTESSTFRHAKERLKEDGHYHCWVCGTTENLQSHHRAAEWMYADIIDFDALKEFCEEWDPYGYGKLLRHRPITSVDDIRNQLILCQEHHTGVDHKDGGMGTGIHAMDFPTWMAQKLAKKGLEPVPQKGETSKEVLKRLEKALD